MNASKAPDGMIRILVLVFCLTGFPAVAADKHRVALARFTTDENIWDSITAAADVTALIQAELANDDGVEWVEREELGLAQKELEITAAFGQTGTARAIQRARWSKADWLVTGRFVSIEGERELRLEVIDAVHADVLAERQTKPPIGSTEPLRAVLEKSRMLADVVREMLREAAHREQDVTGLPIVAMLFFPNSEVFQRELMTALSDPQLLGGRMRLLRFPRAGTATDESSLVAGGFAEDISGAWRSIADFYVWGSLLLHESMPIDAETITDAHTPQISLNVWDGKLSPLRFVEEGEPVARREFNSAVAQQARRLAASLSQIIHTLVKSPAGSVDESQRKRVSRALLHAAEELEAKKGDFYSESDLKGAAGRRLFYNLIQTLEAATFFDPENRSAQEALVRIRWNSGLIGSMRNPFRFKLGRSEAWGQYVDRFGIPGHELTIREQVTSAMRETPVNYAKIRSLTIWNRFRSNMLIVNEYLSAAVEVKNNNKEGNGYPQGVPDKTAADWTEQMIAEIGRRALVAAKHENADLDQALQAVFQNRGPRQFTYRDPKKRLKILEQLWPKLSQEFRKRIASGLYVEIQNDIRWTFEELGKPTEAQKLFDAVTAIPTEAAAPPPKPNIPIYDTAQIFHMPPVTTLPPEVKLIVEKFESPAKAGLQRVHALAMLAGRVWLIGEGSEVVGINGTNKELMEAMRPASSLARRLFVFDPASGKIERVPVTEQFKPEGMLAHQGRLWLALGKDGVAVLDPANSTIRRFGPGDGLDTQSAYRFTAVGDLVFVTTYMSDIFVCNTQQRWSLWTPDYDNYKGRFGGDYRLLSGLGDDQLFLYDGSFKIRDLKSGKWTRYGPDPESLQRFPLMHCVTSDSGGFWVSGDDGLFFLDAQKQAAVSRSSTLKKWHLENRTSAAQAVESLSKYQIELAAWQVNSSASVHPLSLSRPSSMSASIPGTVRAVASDGDYLWVAYSHQYPEMYNGKTSLLRVLHKPTGRWVAQGQVDRINTLALDEKYVWIGNYGTFGEASKCLQRIEKRQFYDIPQSKWMPEATSDAKVKAIYEHSGIHELALLHFFSGDFAAAAELLAQINPQTPETLLLQARCYDGTALRDKEKCQAFLRQLIANYPSDPLVDEAKKQMQRTVAIIPAVIQRGK